MTVRQAHSELVTRLKKPGDAILATATALGLDLLHMAVGIVGEVIELCEAEDSDNPAHIQEELGDLYFFIEGYRQALDPKWTLVISQADIDESCNSCGSRAKLLSAAGHLLDLTKRFTIYNKTPLNTAAVTDALRSVATHTAARALLRSYAPEDILQLNYDKLIRRYQTGSYSDQQAQARADKT